MLRVSAENVLIVPPFECAWLSLSDCSLRTSCCLAFEAKGENDVTVILRPSVGSRRWQHLSRQVGGHHVAVEDNYTIIFGSHRNSRLKIEKNGDTVAEVHGEQSPRVCTAVFTAFWINYSEGTITVGSGAPGTCIALHWRDPAAPPPDIQHVGLSCWDKHVSYRRVTLSAPLPQDALQQQLKQQQQQQAGRAGVVEGANGVSGAAAVPCLLQLAMEAVAQGLHPGNVCEVLQLAELLLPATEALYVSCLQLLSRHAGGLLQDSPAELAALSWEALVDLLQQPLLELTERQVFDLVAVWCGCMPHLPPPLPGSPEAPPYAPLAPDEVPGCSCLPPADTGSLMGGCGGDTWGWAAQRSTQSTAASPSQQQLVPQPAAPPSPAQAFLNEASSPRPAVAGVAPGSTQQSPARPGGSSPGGTTAASSDVTSITSITSAWFRQAPSADDVVQLLGLVRFVLMTPEEVAAVLQHPLVQQYPVLRDFIQQQLAQSQALDTASCQRTSFEYQQSPGCINNAVAGPSDLLHSSGSNSSIAVGSTYRLLNCRVLQQDAAVPGPTGGEGAAAGATQGSSITSCGHPGDPPSTAAAGESMTAAAGNGRSPPVPPTGLLGGTSHSSSSGSRLGRIPQRRFNPRCTELMHVFAGDKNGVVWHLATEYGTQQWVNPVLSKRLEVKASSPASRYTDNKAVVSGQFLHTSWAGPRYSGGRPSSWWSLDLGASHRLLCNYYVLRQDGSSDFARHWVLQGSVDGAHWVDLRRHVDDATIQLPGQYGSWPVTGPAASVPFRAFRVLLTGPTVSATAPWNLCLCFFEFYGYLYKLEQPAG